MCYWNIFKKKKKKLITCLTFCLVTCQKYQLRDIQRQVNVGFWASASTFKQYPVSIPGRYYCCYDLLHPSFRKPFSVNPLMIQPHPFCCLHWRSLKTPFQILSWTLFLISVMVIHEGADDSLNGGNFYSNELRLKYFSLFCHHYVPCKHFYITVTKPDTQISKDTGSLQK